MIQANKTHSLPLRLLTKTTDTHKKCQQNGSKVIVDNSAIGVQCASNNMNAIRVCLILIKFGQCEGLQTTFPKRFSQTL